MSICVEDTIVGYLNLIEALVAAGTDPIASAVNLAELRAAIPSRRAVGFLEHLTLVTTARMWQVSQDGTSWSIEGTTMAKGMTSLTWRATTPASSQTSPWTT